MKLELARKDHYRKLAKAEGYRSRAAFKLKQIDKKYHLLRPGAVVLDVGCAPGGWLEVASEIVGDRGLVVGVDLARVKPLGRKNVRIFIEDVTSPGFLKTIKEALGKQRGVDCVLADLSPKLSGIWDMDHFRQIELCHRVVDLLPEILAGGGSCVMKAFHGAELESLVKRLRQIFQRVDVSKPDASRKESSEVYLVSQGFRGLTAQEEEAAAPSSRSESLQFEHQSESPADSVESDLPDDRLP